MFNRPPIERKKVAFDDNVEVIRPVESRSRPDKSRSFAFLHPKKDLPSGQSLSTEDGKKTAVGSVVAADVPSPPSCDHNVQLMRLAFRKLKVKNQVATAIPSGSDSVNQSKTDSEVVLTSDAVVTECSSYGSRRPDYSSFIDGKNSYLCLQPIKDGPKPFARRPLGVCYDGILNEWIITDTFSNKVILIPSNKSYSEGLFKPSAIAVYEEGISFVVLDDRKIQIFTHQEGKPKVIANIINGARGIAVTSLGNIVTMEQKTAEKYSQHIVVYSAVGCNEVIYCLRYDSGRSPSFIDFFHDRLSVTDLSTQTVSMFRVIETHENVAMERINVLHLSLNDDGDDPRCATFKFVSGIFHDRNGCRLVADAGTRAIYLFDESGPLMRVSCTEALPYTSGIWVNHEGFVALCDRSGNSVRFYKLTGVPEKLPHIASVESTRRIPAKPVVSKSTIEECW